MPKLAKIRRRKKNPGVAAPKRNPPLGTDVVEYIAPGFAAFAATRLLTRIAAMQIAKRYPRFAKHAAAMASAGAFAAAWFGAHRVKYLERYHHPIVVGSGLAALQSMIQLYIPRIGQALELAPVVAPQPPLLAAGTQTRQLSASQPAAVAAPVQSAPVPEGFKEVDVNTWYSYNDAFDAGAFTGTTKAPPPAPMVSTLAPDDDQIDSLLDNTDTGVFS